jgi:DNA-binding NtrC family response regulator
MLLDHYLRFFAEQHEVPTPALPADALERLVAYAWPGNVRELKNVVERLVLRAGSAGLTLEQLPPEIKALPAQESSTPADASLSHPARVRAILDRLLVDKESFWATAHPAFMARDITRDDMRFIIHTGLERTCGNYRVLLEQFGMAAKDYKTFLAFLKQHDCHLQFRRFRMASAASRAAVNRDAAH